MINTDLDSMDFLDPKNLAVRSPCTLVETASILNLSKKILRIVKAIRIVTLKDTTAAAASIMEQPEEILSWA